MGVIKRLLEQRSRIGKQGMYGGGVTDVQYFRDLNIQNHIQYSPIGRRSKILYMCLCNYNKFGWKARMPNFFYRANQLSKTVYDASFDDEILETFKVNIIYFSYNLPDYAPT